MAQSAEEQLTTLQQALSQDFRRAASIYWSDVYGSSAFSGWEKIQRGLWGAYWAGQTTALLGIGYKAGIDPARLSSMHDAWNEVLADERQIRQQAIDVGLSRI